MKRFICYSYETVTRPVTYIVEADTFEEAFSKAEEGNTIFEEYTGDGEVTDRFVTEVISAKCAFTAASKAFRVDTDKG